MDTGHPAGMKILVCFLLFWLLIEAKAAPTFKGDIYPIFRESCISCHGPKKQAGDFRADSRSAIVTGNSMWVVPGNSEASNLVKLLSGVTKTKKAPEKHVLPPEQLSVIRAWINAGAN